MTNRTIREATPDIPLLAGSPVARWQQIATSDLRSGQAMSRASSAGRQNSQESWGALAKEEA